MSDELELPIVRRIHARDHSTIEPALDQTLPEAERLAWQAAVVALDSSLTIKLRSYDEYDDYAVDVEVPGVGTVSSTAPLDFSHAWGYLNGIKTGARAVRRAADAKPTLLRFDSSMGEKATDRLIEELREALRRRGDAALCVKFEAATVEYPHIEVELDQPGWLGRALRRMFGGGQ